MHLFKQFILITFISTTGSITLSAMEPQAPDTRTPEFAQSQEASAERLSSFQEKMAELNNKYPGYSSKLERLLKSGLAATAMILASKTIVKTLITVIDPVEKPCFGTDASWSECTSTILATIPPFTSLELGLAFCAMLAGSMTVVFAESLTSLGYEGTKDVIAAWRKLKTQSAKKSGDSHV